MKRGDSGMTLMELLVVISILGLLVTVMLPFQGRMSDNTKREETIQLLESIRFGLLGAENAYDAQGNRVLGGYVGDYGTLPDFVVHEWDSEWKIPQEGTSGTWKKLDWTNTDNYNYHDASIMPLNLWTNTIRIEGVADHKEIMPNAEWNGPYVVPPRDDYTGDDDLYTYTAPSGSPARHDDTSRHFILRQGDGRLTDGWGSALHIYFDEKENLYFVSAGSDRRINFGAVYSHPTTPTDFGPADPRLEHNDDNLVLVITKEQWNLTDQKEAITKKKLADLKTAILGRYGQVTDGVSQPNGFIADMGSVELLTGSYVHSGSTVYRCIRSHPSSPSIGVTDTDYWLNTGKTTTEYPTVPVWSDAGRSYIGAQPQLLLSNAHYVRVADKYYRYVNDAPASGQTPAAGSAYWVEDTSFEGNEWGVHEFENAITYSRSSMDEWDYYPNVSFGAGWRGPYVSDTEAPLTDAFGKEIRFDLDSSGNVVIRSNGPDGNIDTSDDIIETIDRTNFTIPLTVEVKLPSSTIATAADFVTLFMPYKGKVAYIKALLDTATLTAKFIIDGEYTNVPTELNYVPDAASSVTSFTAGTPYNSDAGIRPPVSMAKAVYHHSGGTVKLQKSFALHPKNTPTVILGE